MSDWLEIDGAQGEGGGQILRSSLSLSLVTQRAVRVVNIRARRRRPGLMRQHLTAVLAAAAVGDAAVEGATIGSTTVSLRPNGLHPGEHRFAVGTAGSATLVLQTVLPPLLRAAAPTRLVLEGGTHNPLAPPFPFLERTFLPCLRRMGADVAATCERPGFYPTGGGRIVVDIEPCRELAPLELLDGGAAISHKAEAIVADLPRRIAERELAVVARSLHWPDSDLSVVELERCGPGNVVVLTLQYEHVSEVICAFGAKGVRAEAVAAAACDQAHNYLRHGAPVGEHLADQLLLPLAMAGHGRFRTGPLSEHARTNIEVIERFLPVQFAVTDRGDGSHDIAVGPE